MQYRRAPRISFGPIEILGFNGDSVAFGLPQQWAGRLDRRVKLWKATVTYNELNEPVETFVLHASLWANVIHFSAKEIYDAESVRACKYAKIIIRYRTDVDEQDRIEHDGQMWKIQGVTEMGRREMLELMAEFTEGNA